MGCLPQGVTPDTWARVERILSEYWSLAAGQPIPPEVRRRVVVQERSTCAVAWLPEWAGKPPTFLKALNDQERFHNESTGLRYARTIAVAPQVRVPDLLHVAPGERAVLTERVSGILSARGLWLSLIKPSAHTDHLWRQLGAWVRALHDTRPVDDQPPSFLRRPLWTIDESLASIGCLLGSHWLNKALLLRDILEREARGCSPRLVTCHGDLAPQNLILAGDELYVIDFASLKAEPPEYDIERLRASVENTLDPFPAGALLGRRICRVFAEGYGPEAPNAQPVIDLTCFAQRLMALDSLDRKTSRSPARRLWWRYRGALAHARLLKWMEAALRVYKA